MTLLLLAAIAHAAPEVAECDAPAPPAAIRAAAMSAQQAYQELDMDGFEQSRDQALHALACLGKPIPPGVAADVHLLLGLDGYLAQDIDNDLILGHFGAAIAASDKADLPEAIAPKGNPLRKLFDQAKAAPAGKTMPIASPPGTTYWIDGTRAADRPARLPFVLQLVSDEEGVLWSGVMPVGSLAPDWRALGVIGGAAEPVADAATPEPEPEAPAPELLPSAPPPPRRERSGPRVGLLVAGGVATLAAGGLYGVAWSMSQDYDDIDNPDVTNRDDLDSLRSRTNTFVWASAGALGVGVVLGATAFLEVSPVAPLGSGAMGPGPGLSVGWRQTW